MLIYLQRSSLLLAGHCGHLVSPSVITHSLAIFFFHRIIQEDIAASMHALLAPSPPPRSAIASNLRTIIATLLGSVFLVFKSIMISTPPPPSMLLV